MATRRELIAYLAAATLVGSRSSVGQPDRPLGLYRDYSRCLPNFLGELAGSAYRRRSEALSALRSPSAIRERQLWVADTFWRLVGGRPDDSPLNPRVTGKLDRDGYHVENVIYESQPRLLVSANLYVPTSGKAPYPGVLFQMGHATNGKAYVQYQRCCQGLARLGFVVLAFDPMGQGERTYYPGPHLFESAIGADEEHTRPGRQMLLYGDTSTRLQTWDAIRSLDYLASHPLVDPERLASAGQSGGGTNTMLLAAVDDRLAVAAIACPNTENVATEVFNSPGSTDDAEQNFVNAGPAGFARWDLLYPLAPKPLWIGVSERDFFGTYSPQYIRDGLAERNRLRQVYQTLGKGDRLAWYGTALPHGLSHDLRMQIYGWLLRWLKPGEPAPKVEPNTMPESDDSLFVSPKGSVVASFGSITPFDLNRHRQVVRQPLDLWRLLVVDTPSVTPTLEVLREASYGDARIEATEVQSAADVWVPAWVFRPMRESDQGTLIVVLHPDGRIGWREGGLYHQLSAAGCVVCAPDLRLQGDLRPEFGRGSRIHAESHNSDEHYAWSSLVLGKPLLGQRVADILALVGGLRARPEFSKRRLMIAACGFTTVPAICAATLDSRIEALYLSGGLVSFENLANTKEYRHPFGNFVPNFLRQTDLPELVSTLSPRSVTIAGAVDGAGKLLSESSVKEAYSSLPSGHLRFLDSEPWDSEALLRSANIVFG